MSDLFCEWEDECLTIPLIGEYDAIRAYDMLCVIQRSVQEQNLPYWTRLIEVVENAQTAPKTEREVVMQFEMFFAWAEKKGCYASAIVIPESKFESFSIIKSTSENAHNGVRMFFDKDIAEQWLSLQRQKHRKTKLH